MRRYSVVSALAVSTTSLTKTYPIGLISGSGRTMEIYDVIAGVETASQDTACILEINGTSAALTAGTSITPTPLDSGNSPPASQATASSAPTGMTLSPANPFLHVAFNGRVTVRWVAPSPDACICFPAGGGAGGSALLTNWQVGTATFTIDNCLYFLE